jgi:micrococcal nuclease
MYEYKCKLERVIDGNTIDAEIDLGFNVLVKQRIKLYGIATPSMQTNDPTQKEQGLIAKTRLIEILPKSFVVKTVLNKRGKIGRVLGFVYIEQEDGSRISVNDLLVEEGTATRYDTNSKE